MMDPMPHYSWIWPNREPIPEYEQSICHLFDDAKQVNKVATNPETINELQSFKLAYRLELVSNKWLVAIGISYCLFNSMGLPVAIACFIILVIWGHCTAWFNVTPRALQIIGAMPGETVIQAVDRRIHSIHSNK